MKKILQWFACLAALSLSSPALAAPELDEELRKGRGLASQLRGQLPAASSDVAAVLKIRRKRDSKEIPLKTHVIPGENGWKSIYETPGLGDVPATKLTIIHLPNAPSQYQLAVAEKAGGKLGQPRALKPNEITQSFLGSDFRIEELGYPRCEFFTWPSQRLLKTELKRGQSCYKLESTNPLPKVGGYARLISWIDRDTGGPVEIHAFNSENRILKVFKPENFQKVDGEYRVGELEISNRKTRSRTTLKLLWD